MELIGADVTAAVSNQVIAMIRALVEESAPTTVATMRERIGSLYGGEEASQQAEGSITRTRLRHAVTDGGTELAGNGVASRGVGEALMARSLSRVERSAAKAAATSPGRAQAAQQQQAGAAKGARAQTIDFIKK